MIRARARKADEAALTAEARRHRRKFGLDAPLPADLHVVERAILRHIAEERPACLPIALTGVPRDTAQGKRCGVDPAAGLPELLLLLPGGRLAFLKIKTQAAELSRAHHAFADLCRERAIPVVVVRSLPEARHALDRLAIPSLAET